VSARRDLRAAARVLDRVDREVRYLERLAATGIAHDFDRSVALTYARASDLLDRNGEELERIRRRMRR
jgi:hypothetical protein